MPDLAAAGSPGGLLRLTAYVVARAVSWKIIVCRVLSTSAMCQHVVGVPRFANVASADVAFAARHSKDVRSFGRGEALLTGPAI